MARVGWLAIIAVGLMIVPSTIAQEGCTVTVTIPVTGASATIRMAVVNTGAPYSAGSQSFTMSNPNYQTVISTSGWSPQGTSNGVVSGNVELAQPLATSGSMMLSATIAGSSPQNYFPRSVSFGGRQCHIQQMRKQ
ncbi:g5177 [Coccomyxa viridis]|uniref:G5177 protein n=1 Tax=Coccomyxa viridis TaxID=1274662 RepID=A0ABP1FW47_9CHLO